MIVKVICMHTAMDITGEMPAQSKHDPETALELASGRGAFASIFCRCEVLRSLIALHSALFKRPSIFPNGASLGWMSKI